MSLDVQQTEKRPSTPTNVGGGANRLQESINRLKPKDQSLNEMYDPPGRKGITYKTKFFHTTKYKLMTI